MEILEKTTIGEFVAKDFRTAALFSKYGIDFCCKGNRTVEEVCDKKEIKPSELLQEIEAVLNYLNIQLRKIRRKHFQKYLEAYNRALTSRDAEKYVDGEQEVIDYECIINSVALLRNRFLGLMKAMESKNFMLGHLTRLKTAGMEDYTIG